MLNHDITVNLLLEGSVVVCGLSKGQEKVPILGVLKLPLFFSCFYHLISTVYTYVRMCMYVHTYMCIFSKGTSIHKPTK